MTNICPREMRGWAVYRHFPASWEQALEDFASKEEIQCLMVRAGFDRVEIALRRRASEGNLAEFARAVRLRITSQLIAISDADYQAGLAWIEAELRQAKGRVIAIPNKWCLIKVVGDKAG